MNIFRALLGTLLVSLQSCSADYNESVGHTVYNLQISTEVPADYKVPIRFQVPLADTVLEYPARIERRGGYSISFPKVSYEIDLEEDIALAGLPADDDWILNANYIDKTFLRHVFCYDLFRSMRPQNEAPLNAFVELRVNGAYQGLYVLMEKLDKSSLGIDGRDPEAYIFKEPPIFIPDLTNFRPQYTDNYYQQTYPKIDSDDRLEAIEAVRSFLVESSDSTFAAEVGQWFDLPNIIDWHLLLLLSNNSDGLKKNFYLYKKASDIPLRVAPWDYDHSFGRDGDNEKNLSRWIDCRRSLLLDRLLNQAFYRTALADRWQELNDEGILSLAALLQAVDNHQTVLKPLVGSNFERWPVDAETYYDGNNFAAEIALMKEYLSIRHSMLSEYFRDLVESVQPQTSSANGS